MILLLDTSTPVCRLSLVDGDRRSDTEWQADRQLAHGLLEYLEKQLSDQGWSWPDISGLGAYKGPGSFTGLRIGLSVLNTLADSLAVPIVGVKDDSWQSVALKRLDAGENDQIVLPYYGSDAHITKPRK